jgi:Reverse transcriptase (RNA-dependent DNA polymerase)
MSSPNDKKVISCKWIYKVKRRSDGSVEHYNTRLVAKGYNEEAGTDYVETYGPVIRATTIRVILSLVVSSNWPIRQLDVFNTFLNGNLTKMIYMHQPQGFADPSHPDYVCLLHKSLYDLKQASRA